MEILGIRMFTCEFAFEPEADVAKALAEQASLPSDSLAIADTAVEVVEAKTPETPTGIAHVAIVVKATGRLGSVKTWGLLVGYQGVFRLSDGAEIGMHDVLNIHGPAQLYSFARELVADLTRRADIRIGPTAGPYFIPPWNFRARA
jgi:preprotein translocase subunit SecB